MKLVPEPTSRPLKIYAFDPSVSSQYETESLGEITIQVRWEDVAAGPVGEYIEVVDVDPASGFSYKPVNREFPARMHKSKNLKRIIRQVGAPAYRNSSTASIQPGTLPVRWRGAVTP